MAAAANNKEERAVMVRTEWRRKVPPEKLSFWNLSCAGSGY
jgi:hypothetical protein